MASTFTRILLHIIFSTKNRVDLITADLEDRLHRYIGGIVINHRCHLLEIGGTENHLHMLVSMAKDVTVVDLLQPVKEDSSKWAKTQGQQHAKFYWQDGYSAFSIGESGVAALLAYIRNQKEHHRKQSFQEELITFLRKYKIPYDERYIWR
jgi:REP element-mobilizing transposase RayT